MTTLLPELASFMEESDDADHEHVLDAALSAFLDFGIRRTSMGEIAKRSGVSPATLYRRFAGKDDVVWAVGRREARRLIAEVDARIDPEDSAEDQAVSLFVGFLAGLRANQLLHRLLNTEPEVVLPLLTVQAGPVLAIGRTYSGQFHSPAPGTARPSAGRRGAHGRDGRSSGLVHGADAGNLHTAA